MLIGTSCATRLSKSWGQKGDKSPQKCPKTAQEFSKRKVL